MTEKKSRKRRSRRESGDSWRLVSGVLARWVLPLCILFAIAVLRVLFNSGTEDLNRRVSMIQRDIHNYDREIKHLESRVEHFSGGRHISRQMRKFNLGLRSANPGQVFQLQSDGSREERLVHRRETVPRRERLLISQR